MTPARYDVAVAGGGPAGAAAALTLRRAGLRVLLANAAEDGEFRVGEGLPPTGRVLLRELGVLDEVIAAGHLPSYGTQALWGAEDLRYDDFIFQVQGAGLQLDRRKFDAGLRQAARAAGVEVAEGCLRLEPPPAPRAEAAHLLWLRSRERRWIECDWLIDASGRSSVLARCLGAKRRRHDALVAFTLRLHSAAATDAQTSTLVEAVSDGWWYSVLLPSRERLVAFLCDPDPESSRKLRRTEALWDKLRDTRHLAGLCRAHGYAPLGRPRGSDASSGGLDRACGERWLAVGDAAIAFDPLSSKGIANALYTGLRGARAVIDALGGDRAAPARYAAHVQQIFRVYREQLASFYALERRWPHATFWRRRHVAGDESTS